jgi:hypothetical protein
LNTSNNKAYEEAYLMPKIKVKVDQELVKTMLLQGIKSYTIEKQIGVPRSVCDDIERGADRPFWLKSVKSKKPKKGMCECCRTRPIYPGFIKLCHNCWKYGDNDMPEEHAVAV